MFRSSIILLWLLAATLAASLVARIVPVARGQVAEGPRLSEILAGPARDWDGDGLYDSRKDEWLEITNEGGAVIDLSLYRIADADSTIRYELSGTLAPGALLVVTGAMAEEQQRAAGRTATGLSLNNSGDEVILFRVENGDTARADSRRYGSIEGAGDRSTGWVREAGTWALFDGLNPYTGSGEPRGTGCAPTPGVHNGCPTPASETTWGKIKRLYIGR
jgi:lamin tail-like protein